MILKYVVSDFAILINLDFIIKRTLGIKRKNLQLEVFLVYLVLTDIGLTGKLLAMVPTIRSNSLNCLTRSLGVISY